MKAIHYIQSFDSKDKISSELAHQISRTFARRAFGDNCQIVIATHVDKEHIHGLTFRQPSHFIINAYGIDGQKQNSGKIAIAEWLYKAIRRCPKCDIVTKKI